MVEFVTCGGGEDLATQFIDGIPTFADVRYYPRRDIEIQSWLDTNGYSCQMTVYTKILTPSIRTS
jgi:hypothetical protein